MRVGLTVSRARRSAGRRLALVLGLAVPLLSLAACGGGGAQTHPAPTSRPSPAAGQAPAPAASTPSLVKVNAGYAAIDPSQLPVWVAAAQGFFRQNGLDVNLEHVSGGSTNVAALIGGSLQFAAGGPAAIGARLKGQDVLTISNPLPVAGFYLVTTPDIKTKADFRGKTCMGSKPGSSGDQALRVALTRLGYTPGKDVKILPGTEDAARLAALESHQVSCAPLGALAADQAVKAGLHVFANMGTMGFPFPETAIDVSGSYLKSHRAVVTDYVKAVIEAIHYIKTDKAGSEAVITKYTGEKNAHILDVSYNYYAPLFAKAPAPTVAGLRTVLGLMAATQPALAHVNAQEFVDSSVVDGLVKSGFVSRLYGGQGAGAGGSGSGA